MSKSKGQVELALPLTDPAEELTCPSLDTAAGELALPHPSPCADQESTGLGELAMPFA